MLNKKYDILIYGDLAGNDLSAAEHLSRAGLKVCLARLIKGRSFERITIPEDYFKAFNCDEIIYFSKSSTLFKLAKSSRLVLTFTAAFPFTMNWRWFFRKTLGIPPVINIPTGSDFSELLAHNSIRGKLLRYYVKTFDINFIGWAATSNILENLLKYDVRNIVFERFPFYLPDINQYLNKPVKKKKIRFFHPSHLDFKVTDSDKWRNSTKGNDRFIRAFIRAIKSGLDAECVILYRGSDRDVAKKMIEESGFSQYFIWKEHLLRDELCKEMISADIVVDQFDVGSIGAITMEAMALKKPVLVYVNKECADLIYHDMPPVLLAKEENEIFNQIMLHTDKDTLKTIGEKSRDWIVKNHGWENCLCHFLFYYSKLTGHTVTDYGFSR